MLPLPPYLLGFMGFPPQMSGFLLFLYCHKICVYCSGGCNFISFPNDLLFPFRPFIQRVRCKWGKGIFIKCKCNQIRVKSESPRLSEGSALQTGRGKNRHHLQEQAEENPEFSELVSLTPLIPHHFYPGRDAGRSWSLFGDSCLQWPRSLPELSGQEEMRDIESDNQCTGSSFFDKGPTIADY